MDQWLNALKAPFEDQSTLPEAGKPTDAQIAVVWGAIGVLIARVL